MSRVTRYVVLHHTGIPEPHFDLMIATDETGPLLTWRLSRWPMEAGDVATPIAPHRRVYLEYEGVVSRGRGQVKRVAAGSVEIVERSPSGWIARLDGGMTLRLPPPES